MTEAVKIEKFNVYKGQQSSKIADFSFGLLMKDITESIFQQLFDVLPKEYQVIIVTPKNSDLEKFSLPANWAIYELKDGYERVKGVALIELIGQRKTFIYDMTLISVEQLKKSIGEIDDGNN